MANWQQSRFRLLANPTSSVLASNYAIKRDFRENISFKFIIRRVSPLFWLLGGWREFLVSEYYGVHFSVIESLCQKLDIPYVFCQDWELTEAQPEQLSSWLTIYEHAVLTNDERTLFLSLLISSYVAGAEVGLDQQINLSRLVVALNASSTLKEKMDFFWRQRARAEDHQVLDAVFNASQPAS